MTTDAAIHPSDHLPIGARLTLRAATESVASDAREYLACVSGASVEGQGYGWRSDACDESLRFRRRQDVREDCDVQLSGDEVSRAHAQLLLTSQGLVLRARNKSVFVRRGEVWEELPAGEETRIEEQQRWGTGFA